VINPPPVEARQATPTRKASFSADFRRFFLRGLSALLPTLITISLIIWVWNFLWDYFGQYIIFFIRDAWFEMGNYGIVEFQPAAHIQLVLDSDLISIRILGVGLAVLFVYIVGVFVGNLLGRTAWGLAEMAVMRVPLVKAIYPAVKQVTDFILAERAAHFVGSRVVAVQPHAQGIWSVGLVTGSGHWPTGDNGAGQDLLAVFIPSTPAAFSGYVLVVPREQVVELPLTVEQAMRLVVTGGVLMEPGKAPPTVATNGLPEAKAGQFDPRGGVDPHAGVDSWDGVDSRGGMDSRGAADPRQEPARSPATGGSVGSEAVA
jgi:uncharacterized membrane protein